MQPTPPGWYWDPGNRPGLFRWWDGHAWSGELTPDRNDPPPRQPDLPAPDADGRFRAGGLSFPALPDPWRPCLGYPDIDGVQGQEIVVGKTARGPYLGAIFIGGLPASFEYAGTDDLDAAGLAFAGAMLQTYYPHEHPHASLAPEPATVDGRPAWRLAVPLDVEDPALPFTAEEALFVLVDIENARPGVLFASLPGVDGVPNVGEVFADLSVE